MIGIGDRLRDGGFDGDLVPECFKFADELAFAGVGVVDAAGEIVRAKVAVCGGPGQHMPDDHNEGVGGGGSSFLAALLAEAAVEAAELGTDVGAGAPRGPGALGEDLAELLVARVLPERCRPADSLLPGHKPAHDARCAAVGNRLMSTPISEMTTCAERSPIPGIVASSAVCWAKGRVASLT